MTPIFSVLHATWGRPEKAIATMKLWRERAAHPEDVQYIICADADDPTRFDLLGKDDSDGFGMFAFVEHPGSGSAPAWDFAAKFSTGTWLIQAQDDVFPAVHWDAQIRQAQMLAGLADETPTIIAVSDGYRKDGLLCTAICNRARYKQQGEFLHAKFFSVFSDDDFSIRAYADAIDGKCTVIKARNITFLHAHCYHDKTVPEDETYRRENSASAYAIGAALFNERNQSLVLRGLKTWA